MEKMGVKVVFFILERPEGGSQLHPRVKFKYLSKCRQPTPIFSDPEISSDLYPSQGVPDWRLRGQATPFALPPWRRLCLPQSRTSSDGSRIGMRLPAAFLEKQNPQPRRSDGNGRLVRH